MSCLHRETNEATYFACKHRIYNPRPEYLYHGTSKSSWKQIQKSGYLEPRLPKSLYPRSQLVYMAYSPEVAKEHGEIVLRIRTDNLKKLGWTGGSDWQIGTTEPIPISEMEAEL